MAAATDSQRSPWGRTFGDGAYASAQPTRNAASASGHGTRVITRVVSLAALARHVPRWRSRSQALTPRSRLFFPECNEVSRLA